MVKLCILLFALVSGYCFAGELDYSKISPQLIEKDLASCPNSQPSLNLTCDELQKVAERINDLAMQLQLDRQGYGKAILDAEEHLAQQTALLDTQKDNKQLIAEINANKRDINQRLAIIKWLESPR